MKGFGRAVLTGLGVLLAAYVVWDRVEVYRLSRDIAAIAEKREPIDLSSLDAPLPSDAHREAAQLYVEAAARARDISQRDFQMARLDVDTAVGRVNVAEIEDTYRKDAPALQLLDRAATLPFAGFGDAWDAPEWASLPGLQALGALGALRADLLAYRGDGDAAAAALVAALSVPRTIADSFTRSFAVSRDFGSLRILLRHAAPSAASLEVLQRAFAALPDEDGLEHDLLLRRARLIEDRAIAFGPGRPSVGQMFLLHPFFTRVLRLQIEQFPEVIAAAREPWPDKYATLTALQVNAPRTTRSPLRTALTGEPFNVAALSVDPIRAGTMLAARRVAIATIAVERYRRAHDGALPATLGALVPALLAAVPTDPFSGGPLVFKPASGGYSMYSVDANRKDEGGAVYGTGSMNPMPAPRLRDFGITVPLTARAVAR